jgi:iron complex outermembrane receptor protein
MRKSILILGMSMATLFANAQETKDSLQTIDLDEVYVIGVRTAEDAPVSQSTIRKAELEQIDIGQDAALHLERLSPSVVTYSDAGTNFGNYVSFRLRGMAQDRINVTLNGVPLNDMMDQGVYFSNFADFSNSIESVQVQRGVGTSTNGTSSYAGSINYESISLYKEKPKAELRLTGGSFGSLGVSAEASSGKSEKGFSAYARASRLRSNGFKDYSGSDAHSFFFSGGYLGEKHVVKFTGFMGKTQNHQSYVYVLEDDIKDNPERNNNNPNDVDDFEQDMAQLQYTYIVNSRLSINNTFYYSGARGFFPFAYPDSDTTIVQENYGIENNQYGILSNAHYSKAGFDLDAGWHFYTFDRRNTFSVSPNFLFPSGNDKSFKDEASVFLKARKHFPGINLTVFGDIQLRYVDMRFEIPGDITTAEESYTFINPRLGVTYDLSWNQNIYASFGRTGREPTRIDFFSNTFNMSEEYVNDFEFGYRFNDSKLKLSANLFYMDFENEIAEIGGVIQNTYFERRQNVASSQRYGFELESQYAILKNLRIGLLSTYMMTNVDEVTLNGNTKTNVEQVLSPNLIITPEIQYTLLDRLTVNVNGRYLSEAYAEIFNNPDFIIPSSFILNAGIDYRVSENISASVFVNNITDELYFTDGAPVDQDFDGTPEGVGFRVQAPRNVFARLSLSF